MTPAIAGDGALGRGSVAGLSGDRATFSAFSLDAGLAFESGAAPRADREILFSAGLAVGETVVGRHPMRLLFA